MKYRGLLYIIFVASLVASVACQRRVGMRSGAEDAFVNHRISYSGETLGIVAAWYTGQASNWKIIAKANPTINPNKLKIGSVVRIPRNIVVKDKPLPKSALGGGGNGKATTKRSSDTTTKETPEATNEPEVPITAKDVGQGEGSAGNVGVIAPEISLTPVEVPGLPTVSSSETPAVMIPEISVTPVTPVEPREKTRDELLKEILEQF